MTKTAKTSITSPKNPISNWGSKKPQTQANYDYKNRYKEPGSKDSKTIQGEGYTIQDLLQKHASGIAPPVQLTGEYDDEEPDLDDDISYRQPDTDLTDIDNLVKKAENTNAILEEEAQIKKEAKVASKKEAEKQQIIDDYLDKNSVAENKEKES